MQPIYLNEEGTHAANWMVVGTVYLVQRGHLMQPI